MNHLTQREILEELAGSLEEPSTSPHREHLEACRPCRLHLDALVRTLRIERETDKANPSISRCLEPSEFVRFFSSSVSPMDKARFLEHFAQCPKCLERGVHQFRLKDGATAAFIRSTKKEAQGSLKVVRAALRPKRKPSLSLVLERTKGAVKVIEARGREPAALDANAQSLRATFRDVTVTVSISPGEENTINLVVSCARGEKPEPAEVEVIGPEEARAEKAYRTVESQALAFYDLKKSKPTLASSPTGEFAFPDLAAGSHRFTIRPEGAPPISLDVLIRTEGPYDGREPEA